ncbi:MAG TPA: hypothetical protein ENK57_23505 [Polyangiaceae bacterium]|nr:hypothetical protein [Polyangiaceae bacterium]
MKRSLLAVVLGFGAWVLCWLTLNALLGHFFADELAAFEAGAPLSRTSYLLLALAASLFCSFAAGRVCAALRRGRSPLAPIFLAALLLATGIAVQAGVWSRMPLWNHLSFLALLVPVVVAGDRTAFKR